MKNKHSNEDVSITAEGISGTRKAAAALFIAAGIIMLALLVYGIVKFNEQPAFAWIGGAGALLSAALLAFTLKKRAAEPEPVQEEPEPYVIKHPLFRTIAERYEQDGLSDLVNYISLRGWKQGYVNARDDSIEFIFLRKERQTGVSLFDGYAEVTADLQSAFPVTVRLDMDDYSEPVELWNAIVSAGRDAIRGK